MSDSLESGHLINSEHPFTKRKRNTRFYNHNHKRNYMALPESVVEEKGEEAEAFCSKVKSRVQKKFELVQDLNEFGAGRKRTKSLDGRKNR